MIFGLVQVGWINLFAWKCILPCVLHTEPQSQQSNDSYCILHVNNHNNLIRGETERIVLVYLNMGSGLSLCDNK